MMLSDYIEQFCEEKGLFRFEGDSGLHNFETLLKGIGYYGHAYRFGNIIEQFLSDNPGAVENLIEWICEQNVEDWIENIESHLYEKGL